MKNIGFYNTAIVLVTVLLLTSCEKETPEPPTTPLVSTTSAYDITDTSATSGGNVSSEGGATVTSRGVCWSTSSNPTISASHTTDGSGTGSFTSSITGLSPDVSYYVRAYATNSAGTGYGSDEIFTTPTSPVPPDLSTNTITNVTQTSANCGGNITSNGGATVTSRGVCWSTSSNPTISDSHTTDGSGMGSFTSSITGLSPDVSYYVRAYATNSAGTGYGVERTLSTPPENSTVTDIDGNVYQTVQIGNQIWMADNLKVTRYGDASPIPLVEDSSAWVALDYMSDDAYCFYENNVNNGAIYGAIYNWQAAMNGASSSDSNPSGVQGVCPDGWHLPSDSEWKQLELYLGMTQLDADSDMWRGFDEGTGLKSTTSWISGGNGSNESGFNAFPAGSRYNWGPFGGIGSVTDFWTSTQDQESNSWVHGLGWHTGTIFRGQFGKDSGISVRCIKD